MPPQENNVPTIPTENNQVSPAKNPPEDDHQGKSRSHAFLLILTALLILAGIFGVWYFSQPSLDEDIGTVTSSTNQFADSATSMAGWKTYTNAEYGFEFKYPNDWEFIEDVKKQQPLLKLTSPETIIAIANESEKQKNYGPLIGDDILIYYYPTVLDIPKNTTKANSLDEYILKASANVDVEKIGEIQINNAKAIEATPLGENSAYWLYLEKNNHIYLIAFNNIPDKKFLTNIENQILSTFKFTK